MNSDIYDVGPLSNVSANDVNKFKGIKFKNYEQNNLCYINATINGLLNCESFKHLLNSNVNCDILKKIRSFYRNSLRIGD